MNFFDDEDHTNFILSNFIPKEGLANSEYGEMLRALYYLINRYIIFKDVIIKDSPKDYDRLVTSYRFILSRVWSSDFSISSYDLNNIWDAYALFKSADSLKVSSSTQFLVSRGCNSMDEFLFGPQGIHEELLSTILRFVKGIILDYRSLYLYFRNYNLKCISLGYNYGLLHLPEDALIYYINLLDNKPIEASRL